MDYNEEEDNIENTKRSSKTPSEQTSLAPINEAYYAENRILIPDDNDVVSAQKLIFFIAFYSYCLDWLNA